MKKKSVLFLILILVAFFVLKHLNEGKDLVKIARGARWEYLLAAALMQIIYYYFYILLYQKALNVYKLNWRFNQLLPLVLGSIFVNLLVPLGALAGSSLFIKRAKENQVSLAKISASILLIMLADFVGLLIFLLAGFIILFAKHDIFEYELVGLAVFLVVTSSLFVLLALGSISPKTVNKLTTTVHKIVNKASHIANQRMLLPTDWSKKKTEEIVLISTTFLVNKRGTMKVLRIALGVHLSDLAALFFLFLAFGYPISPGILLAGYSIGVLFWIISPTPQGLGIVESIMPLVFVSLGVDIGVATLVTLTFRGLTIWLPALLGFISLKFWL